MYLKLTLQDIFEEEKSQESFLERYHVHEVPANEEGVRALCKF